MSALASLMLLCCVPFLFALALIVGVGLTAIVMMPFHLVIGLILYKGNWREMLDMEFGTNLRKFPHVPAEEKPALRLVK